MFGMETSTFVTSDKVYLGSSIPGKDIIESFGLVSMVTKGVRGNINDELELLMQKFLDKSNQIGGNAVINFRFETGTYQQNGSGWNVTYLFLYGEAVHVK